MPRTDAGKVAKTEATRLLSNVPIFSALTQKELSAIAGAAKEIRHPEGTVLAAEGDRGIGFFMIVDGTARVTVRGRSRSKLGPGDFFGEISLLDEGPRSATVTAETPITLLGLTAWVFKGLVRQYPSIALKMLDVMASRLRQSSSDITH